MMLKVGRVLFRRHDSRLVKMPLRLVALDEGSDIPLDRSMIVVGRHPGCDSRLESLRVSRHHCCMTVESGDVLVRDLGSTNGIRINGQRVETGRLKPGDELSIAHIRYRFEKIDTIEDRPPQGVSEGADGASGDAGGPGGLAPDAVKPTESDPDILAEAVRKLLPSDMKDRCKIQVIVRMGGDSEAGNGGPANVIEAEGRALESAAECHSDSSH